MSIFNPLEFHRYDGYTDDNAETSFIDDNSITSFVDDNGIIG